MISSSISVLLSIIFIVLAGFHFYWLLGGTYGVKQVIPTKSRTTANTKAIPPFVTFVVGLGLFSFGMLYLIKAALFAHPLPAWVINFAAWLVPSIFTLRAIGEFNYVGFFKKVKDTEFAVADTKLFSPLCLGIGIAGFIVLFVG